MNCININSPEFKNLVAETGIPAYSLDYQIAKWQEANNSFDFPTAEQLNSADANTLEKLNNFELFKDQDELCPNGVCNYTARESTDYLRSIGLNPYPADYNGSQLPVIVKTPLGDFKITHFVSAVAINGSVYIYDMPQHEFISNEFFGQGSNVKLKESYKPRLIPLTLDEIQANYDLTKKDAGKFIYSILSASGWQGEFPAPSFKDYIKSNIKNSKEYIDLVESEIKDSEYTPEIWSKEDYLETRQKAKQALLTTPLSKKEESQVINYYENKLKIKTREYLPKKTDTFSIVTLVNSVLGKIYEGRLDISSFENALSSLETYLKSGDFLEDLLDKHQSAKSELDEINKIFDKVYRKAQLMASFTKLVKTYGIEGALSKYDKSTQYDIRVSLPRNVLEKYVSKEQAAFMLSKYWGNKDNIVKSFNLFQKSYKALVLQRFKNHSIYNKYNTVLNFLKSSDFDTSYLYKVIANEAIRKYKYFENIGNPQYFQTEASKESSEQELDVKIKDFLASIGVDIEAVSTLKDRDGNPIQGVALANLIDKVIQVVEGKAGIDTLPEEAAHFFVEMLPKDSHLFTTMFNTIENYQVYQDVLAEYGEHPEYKNNPDKLKKEAMGKLIAQHIVSQYRGEESAANLDKANRWWNAIWKWIVNKIKLLNKQAFYNTANEYNAFADAATRILSNDVSSLSYTNIEDLSSRFFQKESDTALEVKNLIKEKNKNIVYNRTKKRSKNGKTGTYEEITNNGPVEILNRVSDRTEAPKGRFPDRTDFEKAQDKISSDTGTNVHNALNNIIKRFVESLNNNLQTAPDKFGLSDSVYNNLKDYVTNLFKSYPAGTVFLTEEIVHSKKSNEAGTVDLIIIDGKTGKLDIFDYKTINLYGKTEIPFYKEESWNIQLSRYVGILKEYGIKSERFGKIRVIPISVVFGKQGNLRGLSIGTKDLEQIPITGLKGGEIEKTGVESIDSLISVLVERMKKIRDIKIPYSDVKRKQLQIERLERLKASIKELQLKQKHDKFLEDAVFELNLIKSTGVENMDMNQLEDAKAITSFYSRMISEGYIEEDEKIKKQFGQFSTVQTSASAQLRKINKEMEKRAIQVAESLEVNNLLDPQKDSGFWKRTFRSISQSEHPVIRSFYRLVQRQKDKVYKESRVMYDKIQEAVKDLQTWGKANNLSGTDIFNPFLQFKDGKWTGNLINKYKSQYYDLRKEAAAGKTQKDLQWLQQNNLFDKARYEKMRAENMEVWKKMHGDPAKDSKAAEIINRKLNKFEMDFDVNKHPFTAYGNSKNFLIKPTDSWYSDEYKKIQNTKALKNFYDLFTNTIQDHAEYLDIDLRTNFTPNIQADFIDRLMQNGLGSIAGMKDSISDMLTVRSDAGYGMIDEATGKLQKSIPIYYTTSMDPTKKSKDLGMSLYLFSNMASNHRYMTEIESTVNTFKDIFETRSKTMLTDATGKPIESKLTGKIATYLNSASSLEMFNNYIDYYLYGITTSGKDDSFEAKGKLAKAVGVEGKNVSTKKIFSTSLKWFSAKSLTLNLLSAVANGYGGQANAIMEGAKGRLYNNSQYRKGMKLLATRNKEAYASLEFWDIESDHTDFKKATSLSASKVVKNMTFDKFYIAQKIGDSPIENGTLLAMLQSHTINKDGKIVKIKEGEKSLLEMTEIVDDKVKIKGLTIEEYGKFRRKVKYLYTTMKGNNSNEDISNIKLSILGQALMQFKNWIPRMADERFGELRHTQDLDLWEEGKYRTFLKHAGQVINGNFVNLLTGLTAYGFFGIGSGLASASIEEAAAKKYQDLPQEERDKMTEEEYVQMYKANLRAAALEVQILIATYLLFAMLKGGDDDDDKKDPYRKWFVKVCNRNFQEVSFFTNPQSFMQVTGGATKAFIPVVGLANDLFNLSTNFTGQVVGAITFDEDQMERNKPLKYAAKLFPVSNAFDMFWSNFDSPHDKPSSK